jgi:hypothetical protein
MRNISLIFLLSWVTYDTLGQTQLLGSPTTLVKNRGAFMSDSLLYIPKRTKLPSDTGAIRYAIADSSVYVWTGSQWRNVSITSGVYVPYTGATADVDLGAFSLNAKSIHIKGTGGTGHLGLKHQNGVPSISANESGLYANTNGDLAWQNGNLYASTFKTSNETASRTYTFQNKSYTVADSADVALKVNISDTGTMLAPYLRKVDTSAMLTSYLRKVDTASMLTPYLRKIDTATMLSSYTRGSGTANYIPKFTGSRTFANSLIYDDGSSRIGINTTSPVERLHISGNQIFENTNELRWKNSTGGTSSAKLMLFSDNNLYLDNPDGATVFRNAGFAEAMRVTNARELLVNTSSDAGAYALQVAGSIYNTTGAVLAASSGSVGIGTTSTTYKLNVNGSIGIAGDGSFILNSATGVQANQLLYRDNGVDKWKMYLNVTNDSYNIYNSTNSLDRLTILENGNVGISTTTPNRITEIASSSGAVLGVVTSASGSGILYGRVAMYSTAGSNAYIDYGGEIRSYSGDGVDISDLRFYTANGSTSAERMRINTDGDLLIGTSSDAGAYALQVSGNAYTSGNIISNGRISAATEYRLSDYVFSRVAIIDNNGGFAGGYNLTLSGTTPVHAATGSISGYYYSSGVMRFYVGPSASSGTTAPERMRLTSDGELLIGTSSDAGAFVLQTSGSAYISSKLLIGTTSNSDNYATVINGSNGLYLTSSDSTHAIEFKSPTGILGGLGDGGAYGMTQKAQLALYAADKINIATGGPNLRFVFHSNGGLKFVPQSDAPTAEAGTVYYDADDNKLKVYNGTSWVDLH